ncbi:hypothetical protein DPMN_145311 [Dreissena polymorpha]|uniref:Uncharacterized protein n=1 Tax=Dreissena polymorpha TaxID=45954 RepID=A0A9D4F5R7_DREPO|nr:hypothetical protein DPMN_145311 [Dreissena polymorpha]
MTNGISKTKAQQIPRNINSITIKDYSWGRNIPTFKAKLEQVKKQAELEKSCVDFRGIASRPGHMPYVVIGFYGHSPLTTYVLE